MTGDFENEWNNDKELVERFENSLKANLDLYFEEEELEDIIRFYFENQKFLKALRASTHALEKFPFSIEIKLLRAQCLIFNDELEEGLELLENINNIFIRRHIHEFKIIPEGSDQDELRSKVNVFGIH